MARCRNLTSPTRAVASTLLALMTLAAPAALAWDDDDDDILVDDDEEVESAEEKKKLGFVALIPVGDADRKLADQVSAGLKSEFEESYELVPISLGGDEEGGAVDTTLGQAALAKAEKAAKRGGKLLGKLSFGKAKKAFQAALAQYEKAAPALTDITGVINVHLGLAEVAARQGDEEAAGEALATVARLNPEYNLDPARYPPLFVTTHAKVRDAALKEGRSTITVDHSGVGSAVFIDGREVGTAPVAVSGLPPGKHWVRIFREDAGLFGVIVEVGSGETETVSPGFFSASASGPIDLMARNRFSDGAVAKVAAAGKAAGVDVVVVGVVGKKRASVPAALVAVASDGSGAKRLKRLDFDGDLLNVSIEALGAREKIQALYARGGWGKVGGDALLRGIKAGDAVEVAKVAMRYDVKALPKQRRSRLLNDDKDEGDESDDVSGPVGAGGQKTNPSPSSCGSGPPSSAAASWEPRSSRAARCSASWPQTSSPTRASARECRSPSSSRSEYAYA